MWLEVDTQRGAFARRWRPAHLELRPRHEAHDRIDIERPTIGRCSQRRRRQRQGAATRVDDEHTALGQDLVERRPQGDVEPTQRIREFVRGEPADDQLEHRVEGECDLVHRRHQLGLGMSQRAHRMRRAWHARGIGQGPLC